MTTDEMLAKGSKPQTETTDARFAEVENWADADILGAIVEGQRAAIDACAGAVPALSEAAGRLAALWQAGGRIAYAGAGSSGIIALLDGLELPCTFGLATERIHFLIAGGVGPFVELDQGSEDDIATAQAEAMAAALGPGDAVIAITASGTTPYTVSVAEVAHRSGALVIGIACTPDAPLFGHCDIRIHLATRPEIVAGSTRLNAGTATKCAVNMLSTLLGMRLGHVFMGMMVNVRAENAKLHERAAAIVARAADVPVARAQALLVETGLDVKRAILRARGATPAQAAALVAEHHGHLRPALAALDHVG
jgi:N-acetylmuramic acid 6-phosphate etherase